MTTGTLFEPPPTYALPIIEVAGRSIFNPIWIKWFLDLVGVLNVQNANTGAQFQHNALSGLQGGAVNEFYHLTLAQQTEVVNLIAGSLALTVASLTSGDTTLLHTIVSLTNGAGAQSATLSNAPIAGNPTKWIPLIDNGTTRYVPAW